MTLDRSFLYRIRHADNGVVRAVRFRQNTRRGTFAVAAAADGHLRAVDPAAGEFQIYRVLLLVFMMISLIFDAKDVGGYFAASATPDQEDNP
ncbi:MAG: hypothetical protein FD120_1535 [Gammaproteobacteria bacterium]|nr:MAG: hypothetical protein FD120_1535 [Gammaproteobacteria bacterium]